MSLPTETTMIANATKLVIRVFMLLYLLKPNSNRDLFIWKLADLSKEKFLKIFLNKP